jgi:general secretion pathway protein D
VLGDVPLLGWLFRYSTRKRERTNLLVFLRPVVIRDSEAAGRLTGERYDYIRDTQRANRLPPSAVLPYMPVPELPPVMDLRGSKNPPPPERGSSQSSPDRQHPPQAPARPAARQQSAPSSAGPASSDPNLGHQEATPKAGGSAADTPQSKGGEWAVSAPQLPWDEGQPQPP